MFRHLKFSTKQKTTEITIFLIVWLLYCLIMKKWNENKPFIYFSNFVFVIFNNFETSDRYWSIGYPLKIVQIIFYFRGKRLEVWKIFHYWRCHYRDNTVVGFVNATIHKYLRVLFLKLVRLCMIVNENLCFFSLQIENWNSIGYYFYQWQKNIREKVKKI